MERYPEWAHQFTLQSIKDRPIYQIIVNNQHMLKAHPGFFNICVHKGLAASSPQDPKHGMPTDLPKAATDWPELNFIIYHSCIRPSFYVLQSFQDIKAGKVRTDTHGHSVPNIEWSTCPTTTSPRRGGSTPRWADCAATSAMAGSARGSDPAPGARLLRGAGLSKSARTRRS